MNREPTGVEVVDGKGSARNPEGERHLLRIRALDSVFRLEIADEDLAGRLRVEWSRCLVEGPVSGEVAMPVDDWGRSPDAVGYALASTITLRAIEAAIGRYLMFHACGLTDEVGRALVCIAPSGTGKTTAAATLGVLGFGYITDEAVAVTEDGLVLPYPKPLSRVLDGGPKRQSGPDELMLGRCPTRPLIAGLILLDRRNTSTAPRLEPVDMIDALIAIIPQTSALPSLDLPLQRLCKLIERCGGLYRLTYAEIQQCTTMLRGILGQPPAAHRTVNWAPIAEVEEWNGQTDSTGKQVIRAPYRDAVESNGEALVLLGRTPVRLSALGLTLWRTACRPVDLGTLVAAAVRDHGAHPDSASAVRDAVGQMLEVGLLRVCGGV